MWKEEQAPCPQWFRSGDAKVWRGGLCSLVGLTLFALAALGSFVHVSAIGEVPAAAVVVTTTADELTDNGNCSLREAIQAVNTHLVVDACDGDSDTIELPSGIYTLTLAGPNEDDNAAGDLDIKSAITIQGTGADRPLIDGNQLDRVLQVHASATVTLTNITISNGRAPDGASSSENAGHGGDGGGIANAGTLTLSDCAVSNNRAGDGDWGRSVDIAGGDGCAGGDGGAGGGIANTGTMTLAGCDISGNETGNGGSAAGSCTEGGAGRGGGVYNTGHLAVRDSTIRGNSTSLSGTWSSRISPGYAAGSGGNGGGIYNAGTLTLERSTIESNHTASGGNLINMHSRAGDGGHGGGAYNAGTLVVSNCTVSGNITGHGGMGVGESGDGGDGGGIYNGGVLFIDNGTISGNITGLGFEDDVYWGGDGGGLYTASASVMKNSTGSGLWDIAIISQVRNTILAGNVSLHAGPDCSGVLTSAGYNLIQAASDCTIAENLTGNVVGADPLLRPLANNGGPTWTHALGPGSAAIDAGSCTSAGGDAVVLDQRGIVRPLGAMCDIGAYEAPVFPKVYLPIMLQ